VSFSFGILSSGGGKQGSDFAQALLNSTPQLFARDRCAVAQGAQLGRGGESFVACYQESNSAVKPSGADGTVESLDAFAVRASLLVGFGDRFTNSDSNASW
jgi:hypothetical protein